MEGFKLTGGVAIKNVHVPVVRCDSSLAVLNSILVSSKMGPRDHVFEES
jgi:hypothetical protein